MRIILTGVVLSLLTACGPDGQAPYLEEENAFRTPDGLTPAQEWTCDDYDGRAFGLCNAYCEAQDCDISLHHSSDTACDQLFDAFVEETGEVPPCDFFDPGDDEDPGTDPPDGGGDDGGGGIIPMPDGFEP